MKEFREKIFSVLLLIVCMICASTAEAQKHVNNKESADVAGRLTGFNPLLDEYNHLGKIGLDSVSVKKKNISLYFTPPLSYVPVREPLVENLYSAVKDSIGNKYRKYSVIIYTDKKAVESLIPNIYRSNLKKDASRLSKSGKSEPVVKRLDKPEFNNGLSGRNIALWHSHGWYYEPSLNRWEWQRARLFGRVEDLYTMSYVLPYLVPMLENSGASVFIPRERDIQTNEVVVDNDKSDFDSEFIKGNVTLSSEKPKGFLIHNVLYNGVNPFSKGSALFATSASDKAAFTYLPDFQAGGEYGVYVSYPYSANNQKVIYDVHHLGGVTSFEVDQKKGVGTWIYLGSFLFGKGKNPEDGSVVIRTRSGGFIATDAVRFGGGMGNVARKEPAVITAKKLSATDSGVVYAESVGSNNGNGEWLVSGRPRFVEGARYYMQYAGVPESVYNPNKNSNDYNDDYMSRGDWVNWFRRAPGGDNPGLGIPVDMAFAFHTDAGVTPNDSVIGTLSIFSTVRDGGRFKNGNSKMASRDLADIIQTQIVGDIRALHNPDWIRRGMWDKQYSEAWRPDVPTMLLELLSHQNLADMKYGLDPRFRFDVSRAVYKGVVRYFAADKGFEPVIQPLPVADFAAELLDGNRVKLSWMPVNDPLEPTAKPASYKVYTRIDDGGFDNGVVVYDNFAVIDIEPDKIYSFKVTAINDGGESFPSEILAAGIKTDSTRPALVVNGFTRVCAPQFIDKDDFAGVAWWEDEGVPYMSDFTFVGNQYDFNRNNQWLDDDSPGWGASHADMEGKVIAGNTFDYAFVHGKALMNNGMSFASVSKSAFEKQSFDVSRYSMIDVILGEQKSTLRLNKEDVVDFKIYTPGFISRISDATAKGINIFMSGAYIGTELTLKKDSATNVFASKVLHFKWRTNHASKSGKIYGVVPRFSGDYGYSSLTNERIYRVEAPDGIEPAGKDGRTIFRYGDNNVSSGVAWKGSYGVVVLGVPFETLVNEDDASEVMKNVIGFFDIK